MRMCMLEQGWLLELGQQSLAGEWERVSESHANLLSWGWCGMCGLGPPVAAAL